MRYEKKIARIQEEIRDKESQSGCCIRLDHYGCVQSIQSKCSNITSYWFKNQDAPGPVCGQDPALCLEPKYNKSLSVVDWPICRRMQTTNISRTSNHMTCRVNGNFNLSIASFD